MVNINRKSLLDAAELAAKVSSPKLPHSSYSLRGGRLVVRSTDGESGIETAIESDGDPQDFTVPAKEFASIVKTLHAEDVTIEPGAHETLLDGRSERFTFRHSNSPLPTWPSLSGKSITIKASALRKAIDRCLPAVANDVGRFALNGLYISCRDGELTVCATDGCRAHQERVCDCELDWSGPVTKKSAQLFRSILTGETATLTFGQNIVHMRCGESAAWALTLTGQFPQISASGNCILSFDLVAADACRIIKQALLVQPKGLTQWSVADGELIIHAESETGSADLRIPVATAAEGALTLDARMVLDAFAVHDPMDSINVEFSEHRLSLAAYPWSAFIQGAA